MTVHPIKNATLYRVIERNSNYIHYVFRINEYYDGYTIDRNVEGQDLMMKTNFRTWIKHHYDIVKNKIDNEEKYIQGLLENKLEEIISFSYITDIEDMFNLGGSNAN